MRITQYSDFALRTLIYLAVVPQSHELANIQHIADSYHISKNHLTKVVHQLSSLGLIESVRGKNGGIRLALHPRDINIGAVLRHTEADFALVECFLASDSPNDTKMPLSATNKPANEKVTPQTKEQGRLPKFQPHATAIPVTHQIWASDITALPAVTPCVISPVCQLRPIFFEAIQAFLAVFDRYTLADLVSNQAELFELLT